AAEAALLPELEVWAVDSLRELLDTLRDGRPPLRVVPSQLDTARLRQPENACLSGNSAAVEPDLSDVLGQPAGSRAIEVAAAGSHHTFLVGDPGTGKTMLAARLPG